MPRATDCGMVSVGLGPPRSAQPTVRLGVEVVGLLRTGESGKPVMATNMFGRLQGGWPTSPLHSCTAAEGSPNKSPARLAGLGGSDWLSVGFALMRVLLLSAKHLSMAARHAAARSVNRDHHIGSLDHGGRRLAGRESRQRGGRTWVSLVSSGGNPSSVHRRRVRLRCRPRHVHPRLGQASGGRCRQDASPRAGVAQRSPRDFQRRSHAFDTGGLQPA